MKVLTVSDIKLGCMRYVCGMNENILNLVLSPLCMVYKKVFMLSGIIFLFPRQTKVTLFISLLIAQTAK